GARAACGLHYGKPFLYRYLTAPAVIPLQGKFARSRRCARRFWQVELAKPMRHLYHGLTPQADCAQLAPA
ncbi:MAG: hypothetical protein WCC41_11565, partial [Rhodomicrobium sp.]